MVKLRGALVVLFLLVGLALRLSPLILEGNPGLIGADSFFHESIIKGILSAGSFPRFDQFSWGGRALSYPPGLHLLAASALLSTGLPESVLPFLGPLFFAFTFLAAYAYAIRQGVNPVLPCALLATVPVLVWKTTMVLLPDSLWLFLLFVAVFLASQLNRGAGVLAVLLLAAPLVHPIAFFTSLFALLLSKSRFRVFLVVISAALILAFYAYAGTERPTDIHQDVPASFRSQIFEGANPLTVVSRGGPALGFAALAFPAGFPQLILPLLPAAAGLVELDRVLTITSLAAVVAGAAFLSRRRKFAQAWMITACVIWAILKLSALSWAPLRPGTMSALAWTAENTPASATIASSVGDGYLVAYVAHRKDVIDGHFVGRRDSDERLAASKRAAGDAAYARTALSAGYFLITERSAGEFDAYRVKGPGDILLPAPWIERFRIPASEDEGPSVVYSSA